MAHMTISQLKTICDYLHEWIEEMQDVCGSKDAWVVSPRNTVEQNSIMEALFELKAYAADPSGNSLTDQQIEAICLHLDREKERWSYYVPARMQTLILMRAIDKHLRDYGEGGINTMLRTNDERIGYWFQQAIGHLSSNPIFPVDPENVFPPGYTTSGGSTDFGEDHGASWNEHVTGDGMGRFDVTGATTGTYTQGDEIDTDLYGKSNLIMYCDTGAGGGSTSFNVTCKKIDETTEVKGVVCGNTPGNISDIGTHDTDMYIGITDIAIVSGGVSGDSFIVVSELERFTKIT